MWRRREVQTVWLKELSHGLHILKSLARPKFFKFVVYNPSQSSPSLTILVPLWFIIISLMLLYLSKLLFSGFLPFKGDFVGGQNKKKNTVTVNIMDGHSKIGENSPWSLIFLLVKTISKHCAQFNLIVYSLY